MAPPEPDGGVERSAVLAVIAEAEPVVGAHRRQLDPTARAGVPAHVTVLYPFVPPAEITDATVATLRDAVAPVPAFDCAFDAVGWFGADYVWLAPDPREPFIDLTVRVHRAFPQHTPYGGEHEPEPHLTIGYRSHAGLDALRAAAAAVAPHLPVRARVDRVALLRGSAEPGSWRVLAECPLGER